MRRYPSWIAGLPYPSHDGVLCCNAAAILEEGLEVELRRDPHNGYDRNAVAVYAIFGPDEHTRVPTPWPWHHVGFLPARHATWAAEQLDSGGEIRALVTEIRLDADIVDWVGLAIDMPSSARAARDFTR